MARILSQRATFYGNFEEVFEQLHGKEISYNNLLDIDAAVSLLSEFSECTAVIIKHNNACGLASASNLVDAWSMALEADPVSAFGGVIHVNREVDEKVASEINKIFFEVLIAPSFTDGALEILKQKKNRILPSIEKDCIPRKDQPVYIKWNC